MSQPSRQLIFSIVLCVVSSFAAGQTTYKCGNSYSETPCVDGKAVAAGDKRTDEQKREAETSTARAKEMAGELERDRLKREKQEALALKKAGSPAATQKVNRTPLKIQKPKLIKPPKPDKPTKVAKKKKARNSVAQP